MGLLADLATSTKISLAGKSLDVGNTCRHYRRSSQGVMGDILVTGATGNKLFNNLTLF